MPKRLLNNWIDNMGTGMMNLTGTGMQPAIASLHRHHVRPATGKTFHPETLNSTMKHQTMEMFAKVGAGGQEFKQWR